MAEPILYQDHPAMFRNHPIGFLLSCLLIPAFGLGLLILLVWWLQCRGTSLTVTDQRVSLRRGILSRYLNDVMIADIRNVQVGQSLSQRVFGVGFIGISSSGQGGMEIQVNGLPNPQRIRSIIDERRAALRRE